MGEFFYANQVTPGFFSTLGLDLLAGRIFGSEAANEIVIDRSAAVILAGGVEEALGRSIRFQAQMNASGNGVNSFGSTVVGIVEDITYGNYTAAASRVIYYPKSQLSNYQRWLVDYEGVETDIVDAIRQLPQFEEWEIAVVGTPESVFREQFVEFRSVEILLSGAATFALILALAGVASSLSRSISGDRSQIGIKFALGATTSDVARAYFAISLGDLILVGALVFSALLAAKLVVPTVASLIDLWLLVPAIMCLIIVCAFICYFLVQKLAWQRSINALISEFDHC